MDVKCNQKEKKKERNPTTERNCVCQQNSNNAKDTIDFVLNGKSKWNQ